MGMGQPKFIIDILNPHKLNTYMCINTRGFSNYYAQDINFDIFGLDTGSKVINKYNYQASRVPLWGPASNDFVMTVQLTLDGLMSIRDYKDNSKIIVDKLFRISYGDSMYCNEFYCDNIINYFSVGILPLRGIDNRLYFFDLANQRLWKNSIEINRNMFYEKTGRCRREPAVLGIVIIRRIQDTKGNSYKVILHKSNSEIVYSLIIDDDLVELNLDKDKLCDLGRIEKYTYHLEDTVIDPSRPLSLDYPSCLTFKNLKDYFYFT